MAVIALYGGSFDPITMGHLISIVEALICGLCDQLWVIPSGDGRRDKDAKTSSVDRFEMCKLGVQNALEDLVSIIQVESECCC